MGRNRSSVAETVEQKFNSISPCSRETLARNRTTKLRKIILITSNDCERFILSHSFFIISFLSHYSVNRKEEKKKKKIEAIISIGVGRSSTKEALLIGVTSLFVTL